MDQQQRIHSTVNSGVIDVFSLCTSSEFLLLKLNFCWWT